MNLNFYKDNYSTDLWYLELYGEGASKGAAVNYLKEKYGFRKVVGFGDNLNDLLLFEACDIKVATDNALPEVKTAADIVCGSNENEGVINWMIEHADTSLIL